MIVSYQPLEEKLDNIMLLLNEVAVSLYLYILLSLTDNSLLQLRDLLGWTLTLLVTVTVAVNLLKFLICFNYRRAYFSLKRLLHRLLPSSLLVSQQRVKKEVMSKTPVDKDAFKIIKEVSIGEGSGQEKSTCIMQVDEHYYVLDDDVSMQLEEIKEPRENLKAS
jgi:hypothetical protein